MSAQYLVLHRLDAQIAMLEQEERLALRTQADRLRSVRSTVAALIDALQHIVVAADDAPDEPIVNVLNTYGPWVDARDALALAVGAAMTCADVVQGGNAHG